MLVIAEADGGNNTSGAGEESVPSAEVIVLVFDLARPVLGEHVFETTADGVAVATTAVVGEGAAAETVREAGVSPGITAFDVQQRRTPGVAEPTGDRTEPRLTKGLLLVSRKL